MRCFFPSTWPRTKVSVAHALRVTTENENESLRLPAPVCSCCRAPSAQHYVEFETAVTRQRGNTEMKTFYLSVVIGVVLAEIEAAQGQTEEAQAQTEVDLRPRRARFGISILGN